MKNLPKFVNRICVLPILCSSAVLLLISAQAYALSPPPVSPTTKTVIVPCSLSRVEMQNPDLMIEESLTNTEYGSSKNCDTGVNDIENDNAIFKNAKRYPLKTRARLKQSLKGEDGEEAFFREYKVLEKHRSAKIVGYEAYIYKVELIYVALYVASMSDLQPACEKSVVNIPMLKTVKGWYMMPIDEIGTNLNRKIKDELQIIEQLKSKTLPYNAANSAEKFITQAMQTAANCKLKL